MNKTEKEIFLKAKNWEGKALNEILKSLLDIKVSDLVFHDWVLTDKNIAIVFYFERNDDNRKWDIIFELKAYLKDRVYTFYAKNHYYVFEDRNSFKENLILKKYNSLLYSLLLDAKNNTHMFLYKKQTKKKPILLTKSLSIWDSF